MKRFRSIILLGSMLAAVAAHPEAGSLMFPVDDGQNEVVQAVGFHRGKTEPKLGIRASQSCQIFLDDVYLPREHVLGEVGQGFKVAMSTLDGGRIGIAAQALGIARASFEDAGRYALERKTFGQPIAHHQSIQWKLADMATETDAARLLTLRAASLKDRGVRHGKEAAMAAGLLSLIQKDFSGWMMVWLMEGSSYMISSMTSSMMARRPRSRASQVPCRRWRRRAA